MDYDSMGSGKVRMVSGALYQQEALKDQKKHITVTGCQTFYSFRQPKNILRRNSLS